MSSGHVFRNPDILQELNYRKWFRDNMPSASAGYVVEDLDLVLRVYSERWNQDATGKFMLVELKFGWGSYIGRAQIMTFGLMHKLLRIADPEHERYSGYYVVQYDNEDWDASEFKINRVLISREQWVRFVHFDIDESIPKEPKEFNDR